MLARIAIFIAYIAAFPAALSAQNAPHVEVAGTLVDVMVEPVYFRPVAELGTGPATLERVGRMFDVATPGIDLAIYIGSRVQGIVRRSLFERAGGPPRLPPLPLPPQGPGIPWIALLVRSTESVTRGTVGAAVDVISRPGVRVAVGGGLQVDRVTVTQEEWMISLLHSSAGPRRGRDSEPVTLKTPVVLGRVKIYPWKHLLTFADVSVRVTSATGERALYEAARVTPGMGVGLTF